LRGWHEKYGAEGLVVIGNHYPEFAYERDLDNLTAAVKDLGIDYAVAQDNDRATWDAYGVRYWPTLFLIDKNGDVRYTHIGEGRYEEIELAIHVLLAEEDNS
jgi:hypothetical protein